MISDLTRALGHQKGQTARYMKALEKSDDQLRRAQDQVVKLQGQIETLNMNHKGVLGKIASLEDRNRQLTRMMEARRR
jgi:septal ring factor EnvC (AmiA/AmiB activator)